jgi:RNA polymerase sigma-70 factor (ECF subfamily)
MPMMEEELHEWIRRMGHGDKEAFRMIYEQSKGHVYQTVSFLVSSPNDVGDVVNEVYLELFRSLGSYRMDRPFKAWLNGLIVRQTRSWNRKIWRRFRLLNRSKLLETVEHAPNAEQILLQNEHGSELIALVQQLSYKHSVVIVLRYFQECSFEEMADILDIPVGTVKSRHHAALEKLRKKAYFKMNVNEEAALYVHRKSTENGV